MGCGEAGDWNAVRRTRHVIEADRVAKLHGARFAAMFPADADLQLRADAPTGRYGKSNQLANSILVKNLEWIVGNYTPVNVIREEPSRIVPAQAKSGLGQIIGAKGEELRGSSDLIRRQRRPRQLDHGPDG